MNKITLALALVVVIFVAIKPGSANAAFSGITGRNSNASAVESNSDTSHAVNPTANVTVGKILFASCTTDNAQTTDGASTLHTVTDSVGNTWIKVFEETETDGAANDGSTNSLWWTKVSTQISTTDTVTCTLGSARTGKILTLIEATITNGNTIASTTGYTGTTHSASGTSVSRVLSGLTNREYLFFGFGGAEGNDNAKTAIANYTEFFDLRSLNDTSLGVTSHVGTRILTGTGDTWTSSVWTFTSAVQSLTAFYEIADPTAALSGTITSGTGEADIVAGGKTIILTLTNAIWTTSGATFDAQRQNIINGLDSAQAEGTGWDAVVKAGLAVTSVARTSNTVVTITLSAFGSYNITATETITATIPYTALENAKGIVASPTFTVSPSITLGGTVCTNEACSGNVGANKTVNVRVNGAGTYTDETDSSGVWSVGVGVVSGNVVTAYIDNETEEGTTVLVSDGTAKSDIHIYQNTVAVRHDTGSSIIPDNLFTGDDGDDDVKYVVSASSNGNLTVDSGFELHVWTGDTFDASGGTVTTQGSANVHVDDNAVFTLDTATNSINGDLLVDGGATANIRASTNILGGDITTSGTSAVVTYTGTPTVTLTLATGSHSIGGGTTPTLNFYNLSTTTSGSGIVAISNTTTVGNDISIGSATTMQNNASLTATGDISVTGKLTIASTLAVNGGGLTTTGTGVGGVSIDYSGTPTATIATAGTLGGGTGTITFYGLTASGVSSGTTVSSSLSVNENLTIGSNHTFALGTNNLNVGSTGVTNSGNILTTGTITQSSSATTTVLSSSGGAASIGGAGSNTTFYNLTFAPTVASAPTFTLGTASGQTINVSGAMTIGNGTNPVTVNAETNDPILNVDGNFVFSGCTACSTTFSASSTASFTVGGNWTNVSAGVFTPNSGTVVMDATSGSPKTITSAGDSFNNLSIDNGGTAITWELQDGLDVNGNLLIDTSNTLDTKSGGNFSVNVAGNWTNNGTYTSRDNATTFDGATGTTQIITGATTFYNLNAFASGGNRVLQFAASTTFTISSAGEVDFEGTSCNEMLIVRSSSLGSAFTFANSGTSGILSYVDFQDTTVTTNLFTSGTGIINSGGNTGITFDNICEGASNSADASNYSFQRKTFKDEVGSVHWLMYHDGDQIEAKGSIDNGSTWTRAALPAYDTNDFSLFEKTISATSSAVLAVKSGDDIVIRRLESDSEPSIAYTAETTALNGSGASDSYSYAYVSLDSSNYIWVMARHFDGSNYVIKATRSNNPVESLWSGITFETAKTISDTPGNANAYGNIVPLANRDMYATFVVGTAMEGCVYDYSPDSQFEDSSGSSCEGGGGSEDKYLKVDTYTASDTWSAPTGVTEAFVELWGAGGGGTTGVGGGGGAAYAAKTVTVTPSTGYAVAVGTSAANTNGGDSTFDSTTVVADGGLSGTNGGTAGTAGNSTGDVTLSGGAGALGTGTRSGGGSASDRNPAIVSVGGLPNGANGSSTGTAPGNIWGAGGASTDAAQSAGARGHAKVSYTVSPTTNFAFVRSRAWNRDFVSALNRPISLPSNYHVGDLLLLVVTADGNPTVTMNGGWTKLNQSSQSTVVTQAVFYKVATGFDNGNVETTSTIVTEQMMLAIGNAGTPEATFGSGNSTNADPPSHTPSGGSAKYMWIAAASWDGGTGLDVTAGPSGYSSFIVQNPPTVSTGYVVTSERLLEASSENPGAVTSTLDEWVASTISVPYSPSSETDKHLKTDFYTTSNTWTAPTGVTQGWVELWGAGGGGTADTGAGGGGAYAAKLVSVTPGNGYSIAVGTSAEGTDGEDSTFATTTVVADGGLSGTNGGTGGIAGNSTGDIKFSGGNGVIATGVTNAGGGAGELGNGSGTSPGENSGGFGGSGAGNMFAAGGGSNSVAGNTGARGPARVTYKADPTANYPYVRSRSWGRGETTDATTRTLTLPPNTHIGDLLVVIFSSDGSPTVTMNTGWTKINQVSNSTLTTQAVFYKVATSYDVAIVTTSAGEQGSFVVLAVANAGTPEATFANGDSTNANPPSHTPSGGSAKYLWLASGTWDHTAAHDVSASPTNYGGFTMQPTRGNNGAHTAVSERLLEASSDDPGTFTSTTEQWVASTISIPFVNAGGDGSQDAIDTVPTGLTKTLSAVSDSTNYDVHLVFVDDESTDQISYRRWDNGTTTWQTATLVPDASGANDAYPVISIDTTTRDLTAFWIDTSANVISYAVCDVSAAASECSTASDWAAETQWKTGSTFSAISSSYGEANEVFAEWSVGSTYVTIDWDRISAAAAATLALSDYRWFVDNDSLDVGTNAWSAATDIDLAENTELPTLPTAYDPLSSEQEIRLRVGFTVSGADLTASSKQFKLQYREATDTSCTSGSWSDLGPSNAWNYATSGVTDGATIVTPRLSFSDTGGQYAKSAPTALNENSANEGFIIEYDFHIVAGSAFTGATRYLFRVVESGGTLFDQYTNCPALNTEPGTESLMRHGEFYTNYGEQGFWWAD